VDISQADIEMLENVSSSAHIPFRRVLDIVIGHEFGHWEQQAVEGLEDGEAGLTRDEVMKVENQADCFSGFANSQINQGTARYAHSFYSTLVRVATQFDIQDNGSHGTPAQRAKSFTHGTTSADTCFSY
jgi:predicted metalloprotease